MRSLALTLLLAVLALVALALVGIRVVDGSLTRVFGAPLTEIGEPLYDFDPAEVETIYLFGNGPLAKCVRTPAGWQLEEPWQDRMDPRAVQTLFEFTLGTRVEGAIPTDKLESDYLDFEDGRIRFRFQDANFDAAAKFNLGHRTAWVGTDPETGDTFPTVFVEPRDRSRKDFVYACTDKHDIHHLLADGFRRLRDHHPFFFHPAMIESIRVRNRGGELVLARETSDQLWQIAKPLGLQSDREALVRLVQGLYDLKATRVRDRSTLTLPSAESKEIRSIGLRFFNRDEEVTLEIYPPESDDADTALATVSDRPNAVFDLPLKSMPDPDGGDEELIGVADLPDSVNELRDPTLTNLEIQAVREIRVAPAGREEIRLARETPRRRFTFELDGETTEANEFALFSLIQTVTETPVTAFVSDTASNLAPYGLDDPFLTLRFQGFDDSELRLDFGQGPDGTVHAMRHGTTTVVEMNPGMIPLEPWEWRHLQLWEVSKPDVIGIRRRIGDGPRLELGYKYVTEKWIARVDGGDRTPELIGDRADRLLDHLLGLRARHWLRPAHGPALTALADPDLSLSLLVEEHDERGEFDRLVRYDLAIARVAQGAGEVYYGLVNGIDYPFLLDPKAIPRLEVDLFGER